MTDLANRVDPVAGLAWHRDQVDSAFAAMCRMDRTATAAEQHAAASAYARAQEDYRRFRDRWCRGGRGVRGGTV